MNYKTVHGITVLEGLEVIRRRPAMFMFIGTEEADCSLSVRLLEIVIHALADDVPPLPEIRIALWRDAVVTVTWDGAPLPIEPFGRPVDGVSHPALYSWFQCLNCGQPIFGPILNALSERLVVSTVHDGLIKPLAA